MVGEDGFEPSKSKTTDLQSAPFGHSGTLPYKYQIANKAITAITHVSPIRKSLVVRRKRCECVYKRADKANVMFFGNERYKACDELELVDGLEPPTC